MSPLPPEGTLLVISVAGVPLYSARGLSQTLDPIKAALNTRRTINAVLIDISMDVFHKYESKISCTDVEAPALDCIRAGMEVDVDCVAELVRLTTDAPKRTVVPGSERVNGSYTIYRPRLTMLVTGFSEQIGEYSRDVQWELSLEEK